MRRCRRSIFHPESLEPKTPLAGDIAGALADNAALVVQLEAADTEIGEFAETTNGFFFTVANEVWNTTDGQAELVSIVPGRISSGAALNDQYLFTVNTGDGFSSQDIVELWVSDGSDVGTRKLAELGIWDIFSMYSVRVDYDMVGDIGFLTVGEFEFDAWVGTLWTTDGTPDGTAPYAGEYVALWEEAIHDVAQVGDDWFFVGRLGQESKVGLWKTDPIAESTELIQSFNGTPFAALLNGVGSVATAVGNDIYFIANDGVTDYELWKSDGTTEGTALLKDINPNPAADFAIPGGSAVRMITDVEGRAFFIANDGVDQFSLWTSDGTTEGTVGIAKPAGRIEGLAAVEDRLYFTVASADGTSELWMSDGTEAGTSLVTTLPGRAQPVMAEFSSLLSTGGSLFFVLDDGTNGAELWVSDGTAENTAIAIDVNTADGMSSLPRNFLVTNDQLQFLANDGTGDGIWTLELEGSVGSSTTLLAGDVNGDGEVDFRDFLVVSLNFGTNVEGGDAVGDFDRDGDVDFVDFLRLSKNYGQTLPSP